jgi:orotate phosphoribosyltransferase
MQLDLESPGEARARLRIVIREQSLRFGDFVLASGARSRYYLDLRRTTTHPEGAVLTASLLLTKIRALRLDAVGGPTLGADPILGAIAVMSHLQGSPVPVFIVRKDAKDHGARRLIEGHLEPRWRVAVLDDVVTRGGSILRAVDAAREAGAEIDHAFCVVDREDGGREALAERGVVLDPIFRVGEILNDG